MPTVLDQLVEELRTINALPGGDLLIRAAMAESGCSDLGLFYSREDEDIFAVDIPATVAGYSVTGRGRS